VGVDVGIAVGGSGVLEGIIVGCRPGDVAVGLDQAGGWVWVGKITAGAVRVGLKRAVMVRSGVGNAKGVGEATKGKLQARSAADKDAITIKGISRFFLTPTSNPTCTGS
jgi:hypothetical protein